MLLIILLTVVATLVGMTLILPLWSVIVLKKGWTWADVRKMYLLIFTDHEG